MSAGRTTGASCSPCCGSDDAADDRSSNAAANRADVGEDAAEFCERVVGFWNVVAWTVARSLDKCSVVPIAFAFGSLGARSIGLLSRGDETSVFIANDLANRADSRLGPTLSF